MPMATCTRKRILVVEDDTDISNLLCRILRKAAYEVIPAYSGSEAVLRLDMGKEHSRELPDLILLDLMLPGISGEEVIRVIREDKKLNMPVIVLSAKTALQNKVETLTAGADDYIMKPFEAEEVLARVHAALRRYGGSAGERKEPELYCYKKLCVYPDARKAMVGEKEITLTRQEYELLSILIKQPQKVYSRETLYELVWKNGYYGEDNTVNVHISNIRKKIAAADAGEEYIKTVWGIGFKMA